MSVDLERTQSNLAGDKEKVAVSELVTKPECARPGDRDGLLFALRERTTRSGRCLGADGDGQGVANSVLEVAQEAVPDSE